MISIANGESGLSVRTKLNEVLTRDVASVSALLADTELTYSAGQPGVVVAGDVICTRSEGFSYQVAASGATNQHVTTAGGVKLYVLPPADVRAFGAAIDNTTDDTAEVQAMVAAFGYYTLPAGTCRITDTIVLPTSAAGKICSGQGMEISALNYQGAAGKAAVSLGVAGVQSFCRLFMRDHSILGIADNAFKCQMTDPGILYNSSFDNMRFTSTGTAFVCNNIFSARLTGCRFNATTNGHGVDLWCGPSVVLTDCYPETITGTGRAGFRIRTAATMIGCNGLNAGEIWAIFGNTASESGSVLSGAPSGGGNAQFSVSMSGCNMEDFTKYAIGLRFAGRLTLAGANSFAPKGSNSYETYIDATAADAATLNFVDLGSVSAPKAGAVRTKGSNFVIDAANVGFNLSVGSVFPDFRWEGIATTYKFSQITGAGEGFGVRATRFDDLTFGRAYGFVAQRPETWTVNATNMSLAGRNNIKTANTAATSLQYASGGVEGQRLTIIVGDANTTIQHNVAIGGRFMNKSGGNYVATSGQVYEYVNNGSNWVEV